MIDITNPSEIKRIVRKLESLIKWSQEVKKQHKLMKQNLESSDCNMQE